MKKKVKEGDKPCVGHYGCEGRLVRVLPIRGVRKPHWSEHYRVDCPSCEHRHIVRPTWRRVLNDHEREDAKLQLKASDKV